MQTLKTVSTILVIILGIIGWSIVVLIAALNNGLENDVMATTLFVLYLFAFAFGGNKLIDYIIKKAQESFDLEKAKYAQHKMNRLMDAIYDEHPTIMKMDVPLYNDEHEKIGTGTVWSKLSDTHRKHLTQK